MHVRFEITQYVFIQIMNYNSPAENGTNWTSSSKLKETFESVDRQQATIEPTAYPISSPRAFGSGKLKMHKICTCLYDEYFCKVLA